ncbi:Transglycosylase SLT domain-containing protein [Thalassospira xiamenensis M-5 = DSM 17429]|uniref:Transglycosylase SLT domain-containing protein n=1 Tax=Thalassospira xiamenensis M-5 = DSM 17429 TaxID=1123366 RepID=A0AB72UJQ9_9PROT|nr:lytic transglycosylase domain-containing protein [Thalassospira xiamenensis]AJD54423.1 hypothetical protein TH3_21753 [Thalassospira xiamenensis M-5 = DSM 17429]SIT22082.1 Transglycosylase SLT domain-containing protein [Thalassospira xiamenensis M-5 = DSM 17429]
MSALSVIAACVMAASANYQLPPAIIWSLLSVEGGKVGTVSRNSNGTSDLGPMQINTIHVPLIASRSGVPQKIVRDSLVNDPCYNISIGAWHLRGKISEVDGDFWTGVGRYHSKTPRVQQVYMRKLLARIEDLYGIGALSGAPLPDVPVQIGLVPAVTRDDIPPRLPDEDASVEQDETWGNMQSVKVASTYTKSPSKNNVSSEDVDPIADVATSEISEKKTDDVPVISQSGGGMIYVRIADYSVLDKDTSRTLDHEQSSKENK